MYPESYPESYDVALTYENNLFALSYLLSSVLIYNSAYPVDSHHIDELKVGEGGLADMPLEHLNT